jgi:hypothetical protein
MAVVVALARQRSDGSDAETAVAVRWGRRRVDRVSSVAGGATAWRQS